MKICQAHWDRLRAAIKERGLEHLVAKDGATAMMHAVTELEGREAENDFDPLNEGKSGRLDYQGHQRRTVPMQAGRVQEDLRIGV